MNLQMWLIGLSVVLLGSCVSVEPRDLSITELAGAQGADQGERFTCVARFKAPTVKYYLARMRETYRWTESDYQESVDYMDPKAYACQSRYELFQQTDGTILFKRRRPERPMSGFAGKESNLLREFILPITQLVEKQVYKIEDPEEKGNIEFFFEDETRFHIRRGWGLYVYESDSAKDRARQREDAFFLCLSLRCALIIHR